MASDDLDCLTAMICDHQRSAVSIDPFDADARAQWLSTAALLLWAVQDPWERFSYAHDLAIAVAMRCHEVCPRDVLNQLKKGW